MDNESDVDFITCCAKLVTEKKAEAFPLNLLRDRQPGKWVSVKDVCQETGIFAPDANSTFVATWLPDPDGNQDYAVIIFYDSETLQSFAAHHNRKRIIDSAVALP